MALTGGDVVLERGHDGRVAYLTLSHGKYTVVTMEMRRLVAERFAEIDRDPQVRVVVVRARLRALAFAAFVRTCAGVRLCGACCSLVTGTATEPRETIPPVAGGGSHRGKEAR